MSVWDEYPQDYRAREVEVITSSARAGESVALVGLSGSGKSNLFGYIANRKSVSLQGRDDAEKFLLVDCNRMADATPHGFYRLILRAVQPGSANIYKENDLLGVLETALGKAFVASKRLCLLFDRFDVLTGLPIFPQLAGNLRALRDVYKYRLSYVVALRRPVDPHNELAELFFGHTLWLGPLERSDALWSAQRDMARMASQPCEEKILAKIVEMSWGYPSLLRAVCEAYSQGAALNIEDLRAHPAVQRRVKEFLADNPQTEELRQFRLLGQPLLQIAPATMPTEQSMKMAGFDTSSLTLKENLLLQYLLVHPGSVCEKDELVQAIWPEDVIFEQGVRDESLAQLVRRLRVKIEPDPGNPKYIQTIPGRGYIFKP